MKRTANPTNIGLLEEPAAKGRDRKPPSRRLIRHVLRARVEATNALAAFFDALSRDGWAKQIKASPHLARTYRGEIAASSSGAGASVQEGYAGPIESWRYAGEVIAFLKQRGAKIPSLGQGPMEDDWALSSEGEGSGTGEDGEEPVWKARSH